MLTPARSDFCIVKKNTHHYDKRTDYNTISTDKNVRVLLMSAMGCSTAVIKACEQFYHFQQFYSLQKSE